MPEQKSGKRQVHQHRRVSRSSRHKEGQKKAHIGDFSRDGNEVVMDVAAVAAKPSMRLAS